THRKKESTRPHVNLYLAIHEIIFDKRFYRVDSRLPEHQGEKDDLREISEHNHQRLDRLRGHVVEEIHSNAFFFQLDERQGQEHRTYHVIERGEFGCRRHWNVEQGPQYDIGGYVDHH